jgi:hypothetical protein
MDEIPEAGSCGGFKAAPAGDHIGAQIVDGMGRR